LKQREAILWDH